MILRLTNYRIHAEATLDLGPLTLVTGPNAAGKSSIAGALAAALLGRNAWTDRAGRGLADQIKEGADEARIRVEGLVGQDPAGLSFTRTITRAGSGPAGARLEVDGFAGNTAAQERALLHRIVRASAHSDRSGLSEEVLAIALGVERFVDLPAREQTAVLFDVTGRGLDRDDLAAHFVRRGIPDDEVSRFVPEGSTQPLTPDDVETFYRAAFASRAQAKRALAAMENELRAAGRARGLPADPAKEADVRATLAEVETRERALVQELAQSKEAARVRQAIETGALADRPTDIKKHLDEATRNVERIENETVALAAAEPSWTIDLDTPPSLKCPALGRLVRCPANPVDFTRARVEAKERIKEDARRRQAAEEKRKALDEALQAVKKEETAARSALARVDEAARLLDRLKTLGKPRPEAAILDDLGKARDRIAQARDLLVAVEAARRASNVTDEALTHARAEVETLEKIVAVLAPDERAALARDKAEEAFETIAERVEAATAGEYSVRLTLKPDLAIRASRRGQYESQPIEALSASERLRLDLVLRDVIASTSGAPVLVLDEAEALDDENLALVLKYLAARQAEAAYDLVLVVETSAEPVITGALVEAFAAGPLAQTLAAGAPDAPTWREIFIDEGRVLEIAA